MRGDINITELILCAWCHGLNTVLSNSHVEALAPSVTVFRDMYYKEMVRLKWGQKGRPWDDRVSDLLRRDTRELALTLWEYSKDENAEKTICKSGKGLLPEFNYAGTLILYFPVSELWENSFCCLNHPVYEKKWKCKSFSLVGFFVTPWIVIRQTPLSMEFSRQEYWMG